MRHSGVKNLVKQFPKVFWGCALAWTNSVEIGQLNKVESSCNVAINDDVVVFVTVVLLHIAVDRLFAVADPTTSWQWSRCRWPVWKHAWLRGGKGARHSGTAKHRDVKPGQPSESSRGASAAVAGTDQSVLRHCRC